MKKRILSVLLVFAMIAGLFVVLPVSAAAATPIAPATAFAGGNGTEGNPYRISNAAELALLQAKLADGAQAANYYNKSYVLTADIVLNTGDATTWGTTPPANSFTAIGTWSNATSSFGGHFNGQGHTIKGLYISTSADGQGLFGVIQGGAVIENFALLNSYVACTSGGATGAIVGQTDRANGADITIRNICAEATVVCNGTEVGGIIGNLSHSNGTYTAGKVTVDRATFVGSVNGTGFVAGLVGNARNVAVDIKNCLVYADIRSTQGSGTQYAAGFMCKSNNEATYTGTQTVTNCILAGGSVTCATSGTKRNRAYVSQSSANYKASVNNCYETIGITDVFNATSSGSQDISSALLYGSYTGADAINWTTWANANWASSVIDIVRPIGVAENYEFDLIMPTLNGAGTASNPYQITSAADFVTLSFYSKLGTYANVSFELTSDVSLAGINFDPIGTWAKGFGGHFNGNGHTVSGLIINTADDGQGLFGVIQGGAVIENFSLVNSSITCTLTGTAGAIVGQVNRGNEGNIIIQNIYTDAVLICNGTEVGGIIGNISDSNTAYSAGTVTISNCVFDGKIESTGGYCGGMIGNARNVTVNLTNCANYGTISAGDHYSAGLLVGKSCCYTISGCVNLGRVTGSSEMFAIACCIEGKNNSEGARTLTNTYYLSGSAQDGATKEIDSEGSATPLRSVADFIGMNATVPGGWTKRAGDFAVPSGVAGMVLSRRLFTFGTENGASIRFKNPTGLRFTGVVSKTYLGSLTNVTDFGIVIAPTQYVESAGNFTMTALDNIVVTSGQKYLKISAVNLLEDNNDYSVFSGVIGNIAEECYGVAFSAITYVQFGNGQIYYSAYDPSFNSRSVARVARLAHEDVTEIATAAYSNAVSVPGSTANLYSPYTGVERAKLEKFYRGEKELRVLQQNLLRDNKGEIVPGTVVERSDRFLKEVIKYDPDIILMQEVDIEGVWYHNAIWYLTDYTLVGLDINGFNPSYNGYIEGYHTAILYRTERFEATDSGVFWLKNNPDQRGTASFTLTVNGQTGVYYENFYRPCCYVNLIDSNNSDAAFTCCSFHFSVNSHIHIGEITGVTQAEGTAFREAEAECLMNYLEDKANGNPILFGGDANDSRWSRAIRHITNEGYNNSFDDAPVNVGGVQKTMVDSDSDRHIDWCFYGEDDFDTISYRAVLEKYLGKSGDEWGYVSDHCGVISDIVMHAPSPNNIPTPPNDNVAYPDFAIG